MDNYLPDQPELDSSGLVKPLSAYFHFMRMNSAAIREMLIKEGKEIALGAIATACSAKWKSLPDHERARYEDLALEDKERYQEECAKRDEEALKRQEERRKANSVVETDTRMRNSTLINTDASTAKLESKRKREWSEEAQEKKEQKKQAKKAQEDAIKQQLNELKDNKASQAEARLKYLLSQSDIFSHFGSAKAFSTEKTTSSGDLSKSTKKVAEDLDDDEKYMVDEIGDGEDDAGVAAVPTHHILSKQPSIVSGGEMRAYQLEGLNWMIRLQEYGINGILADEMGLGKTLQSISILAFMHEFKNVTGPHLVMVPKSTLSNWCNEFKRWCPSIRVLRFHGSKDERSDIIEKHLKAYKQQQEREWDVLITTYEIVNLEKSALIKIAWRYLIIDEAHRLKNEDSQFSQTVRLLNTQHRLLLTGTPLQNNLHELWALLNFLLPDVFSSSEQFDDWFNLDVDDTEMKQRMISQLHKLLNPFMLRRLKLDVEKSLPPKTETILFTGLSSMQKNLYRQILMRDIDTINSSSNSQQSRTAVLNIVMQLRKCCNHPYLFPGQEDRTIDPFGDHLYFNCGKMVLLDKLLGKLKARGHRVLIFSQMTKMIDILEDYLLSKGYLYCRIDGNTSYEEREDRIYDFNREGSDKFIFVLSTRAGGLGINLQTADTVILYDSDWNPQADLQAQDRAHRIGQKHPVQVFRLVTDDTVEVKVVERAQQKLKLDAMVVQQGRLVDKDKKMSKNDLLDTLRFGADKIFRSKESTITDDDIDTILEEGRKRTEEIVKLQAADKGDMYDFRLDGGMATQVFEGKDYSDKSLRADANPLGNFFVLDIGRRERKTVASYAENVTRQPATEETRPKLPKHLRLNKMEDWQFFDRTRLNELQNEEIRLFDQLVDRGEAPTSGNISKLIVLPPDLQEEKLRLLSSGFGDWNRNHFNNFLRASAKHGRREYDKIAKDVGRSIEETKRYAETFWERGPSELQPQEFDRALKQVEKGEKRLEEISRLTAATAKLISMFEDPWEELTFRNVGNVNRIFTAVEDRYLLCLTHLHGYGNWEQVRNSIRRCERFRFDFYLQSCSAEALGKRCELLMRSAERELIEIERKRQAAETIAKEPSTSQKNATEVLKQRVADISKQLAEETRKLALVRAQMKKLKGAVAAAETASSTSNAEKGDNGKEKETKRAGITGPYKATVPEHLHSELCKLVAEAGADGIYKISDKFNERHPHVSKRQTEVLIAEMAYKDKKENDTKQTWYIKPEFLHLLTDQPSGTQSASKPKKDPGSASKTPVKRPREDDTEQSPESAIKGGPVKEPKKFKRAFGIFVKQFRAEAEAKLGPDAEKADALKNLLTKMWEDADANTRKVFEKKEQEDHERYDREMKEYKAWKETHDNSSAVASNKKKLKT